MRTIDLINVIKAAAPFTYYPNAFPATAADDCAVVRITGGAQPDFYTGHPTAQVLVRAKTPATAESKAWDIYNAMNQREGFVVGATYVVYCTGQQSAPLFIGTDENVRTVYSVNFELITNL